MRKVSREMPADWAYEVLDNAPYITVGMTLPDGRPYAVPLSLAREKDAQCFYFHCALEGEKLDALRVHPGVCLSAVSRCHPIVGPKDGSFTLEFKSAIARGKAVIIEDREEKIRGLRCVSERFLPQHMDAFHDAIERSLDRTCIVRIDLTEPPTGKRKQYDANGDEMKFGRME